ncbi:pre-rRNA-processing protein ESF1 NDAI_0B05640 [Naumovozyma dairenensis CBS 421]|uniref:Uncharacterized protein n=1 Tax=Naumovozyma dairenensis (strain ATCC 10597 / BCRC 20456 / CBS 421 / NBRC 0211 / NRRL Y-12639) TaxID=1071378 RepID=G0W736_NAUDC|nr:hypothetical protein NDAI_0B05640 [Naumovozyma dairenensis CBS 421]CCD23597.1 hypothetical protein NDAI_0B05640 [Naumovozyma dairenensis CBS 421]
MAPSNSENKESTDPRFAKIYNDPKFRKTKNKDLKIKLDDRFSKKDLEIRRKSKVDKYGRKLADSKGNEKEMNDFDKYFEKDDEKKESEEIATEKSVSVEEKEDEEEERKETELEDDTNIDRARGDVPADYVSSSDEYTSSESEASDEEELDSDVESGEEVTTQEPESGEPSKTLAVVNLDWDHVKSSDLMITFSSFLPEGGRIENIAIYPSEFGKERMQREDVEGPPKELFQKRKKKTSKSKKISDEANDSDVSDVDIKDLYEEGDADKDVDTKALRQYQLERLRYYYAVVYCNNIETATAIYQNCDGTEYESTANMFDLRYVPDGMDFTDEPRDQCDSLPKNYKPHQFSTDALQHSNVKLTWDETPVERQEVAKRAFTQKEIDDMDFKAYLASDSDGSEDELNEDAKNKLKALVGGGGFGSREIFGGKGAKAGEDEDEVDMEITFNPALDENSPKEDGEHEETTIEKVARKEKERRKARKQKLKELKTKAQQEKKDKLKLSKNKKNHTKEDDAEAKKNQKSRAELELLMMDDDEETGSTINNKAHFNMNEILRSEKEKGKRGKYQNKDKIVEDEFKPDLNDPRFKEVFEDHDFAIDPSRPEFKETKAMKEILKERSKRIHKKGSNKKRRLSITENAGAESSDITNIVNKLKTKSTSKSKKSKKSEYLK